MTLTSTTDATGTAAPAGRKSRRRLSRLTRTDKIVLTVMLGIPTLLLLALVWIPALLSIVLSFSVWNGIGGIGDIKWVGWQNYHQIFTIYPPFWPAIRHNVYWLLVFVLIATPFGMLLAVLLDRQIRFSRIYQSAIYLPVVLALALIGFMWQLIYSGDQGLINGILGKTAPGDQINWLGDPKLNIWAILVEASWRHVGYVMLLYLAGLKGVDPTLREAAAIDGANERQAFFRVIFPAMRPVNVVILVITVIESLRGSFDIPYITNKGRNGLEVLPVLVTNNIIGEASRIGFGSALAVILLLLSLGFIVSYLIQAFRKEPA